MKVSGAFLAAALLAGCASVTEMAGEPVPVFPVAPDAPETWSAAGVVGDAPQGDWLAQFEDETMSALVSEALGANPTLAARYFTAEAARAAARRVYGSTLPNVSASASAGATSTYVEGFNSSDRVSDPTFGVGVDASWQYDLWGRLEAQVEAAEVDLRASEADLAATQLSIAAQTAQSWIDLNAARLQEEVAERTLDARLRTQELTERRVRRGLVDALDVRTARSAVAAAEAAIAARQQASGNAVRRLEILLARYPAGEIEAPAALPDLDRLDVASSPLLLLTRRPDVAASEARVAAAGLRAEQARLALLPTLQLTGSLSTSDTDLVDALDPTRIAARAIASLAAPVFNGGVLRADRDAAIAQARAAVANYATTVLTAWREVEDAIAADVYLARQEDAQARALEEARQAEDIALRQYAQGLVTIFNLVDAQTRRLTAESNYISARAARASNRISYHLALGGGLPAGPVLPEAASETVTNTATESLQP